MTPWPHMVLYPSLCRNRAPRSAPGVTGGVGTQPDMSKWPRGSPIRARRRWSRFSRIQRRRSRIEAPGRGGRPPVMMRRGSPAACVSMAVMTVLPSLGRRVVQSRFIGGRCLPEARGCAVGGRWILSWLPASNSAFRDGDMTEAEITELLFKRDPLSRSDLALAFGNSDRHVSAERARHAAFLFLHGHTPRLLLSGGDTGDDGRSEAE